MSATRRSRKPVYSVAIGRGLKNNLGLIGRRAATRVENDPGVGQLDVARVFRLDRLPAKNSHVKSLECRALASAVVSGASVGCSRLDPITILPTGCRRSCQRRRRTAVCPVDPPTRIADMRYPPARGAARFRRFSDGHCIASVVAPAALPSNKERKLKTCRKRLGNLTRNTDASPCRVTCQIVSTRFQSSVKNH